MPQSYGLSSCLQTVDSSAVIFYNTLAEKVYSIDFILLRLLLCTWLLSPRKYSEH